MDGLELDHLVVCAENLADGVAYVEDLLGVKLAGGGEHVQMGTHNCLLSLGPSIYLEVITINPDAPTPDRPRWFDLDRFSGPPRLTNWVVRYDDLNAAIAQAPAGIGHVMDLARDDLRWKMAVPENGCLPFDGAYPGLIAWGDTPHPAARLPDQGCRLEMLEVFHPDIQQLGGHLETQDIVPARLLDGPTKKLTAHIRAPGGMRILS